MASGIFHAVFIRHSGGSSAFKADSERKVAFMKKNIEAQGHEVFKIACMAQCFCGGRLDEGLIEWGQMLKDVA